MEVLSRQFYFHILLVVLNIEVIFGITDFFDLSAVDIRGNEVCAFLVLESKLTHKQ